MSYILWGKVVYMKKKSKPKHSKETSTNSDTHHIPSFSTICIEGFCMFDFMTEKEHTLIATTGEETTYENPNYVPPKYQPKWCIDENKDFVPSAKCMSSNCPFFGYSAVPDSDEKLIQRIISAAYEYADEVADDVTELFFSSDKTKGKDNKDGKDSKDNKDDKNKGDWEYVQDKDVFEKYLDKLFGKDDTDEL